MRLRNIPGAREAVETSPLVIKDAASRKGRWRTLIDGAESLYVEIGSGKGRFLAETARQNPRALCLGIERYSTVIYKALTRLKDDAPKNLRFLHIDAELLAETFTVGEIDRIFLNFSDPWPKERHAKRRLTSGAFLERYDRTLAKDGTVAFKTDNRALFDFSCDEAARAGWRVVSKTYDLYADEGLLKSNVPTEYEARFTAQGQPICQMIIRR